jgi:hypothetical protein
MSLVQKTAVTVECEAKRKEAHSEMKHATRMNQVAMGLIIEVVYGCTAHEELLNISTTPASTSPSAFYKFFRAFCQSYVLTVAIQV